MPLPGCDCYRRNSTTAQKVITWTDVDGSFALRVPEDGQYVVRTQMAAFAVATKEVIIGAGNHNAQVNLELILLSPPAQYSAHRTQTDCSEPDSRQSRFPEPAINARRGQ